MVSLQEAMDSTIKLSGNMIELENLLFGVCMNKEPMDEEAKVVTQEVMNSAIKLHRTTIEQENLLFKVCMNKEIGE